ncbi:DUF362 domain-containing protein [Pectinatus cerevisiiphilus]|uniref:Uncharacterized protein DUF362 n=1 Tax=Pectinatus cerevisiiphilus TaxID=86956 RepID=A0A4R3KFB8_9FIRM|nr:DUF362 domain-containing protein [Pectinatus cerevisiiphilus]TCS81968.1 uncharacterized protein DUF362 [Pectinatus cerevisiiphilus]
MLKILLIFIPVTLLLYLILTNVNLAAGKEKLSFLISPPTRTKLADVFNTASGAFQDIIYHDQQSEFPFHQPYGTGVGIYPGRVVWTHDPASVAWDGKGYWWNPDHFDEKIIGQMVRQNIMSLTGTDTAANGWNMLFTKHNEAQGNQTGYIPGQKIAIKVNLNGTSEYSEDSSGETQVSYANPVLLKTVLTSLIDDAGVRPEDITVYDVSRLFPKYMVAMCTEGKLNGVNFVGRDTAVADKTAPIVWSQQFDGSDVVSYLPTVVTEASYIINLANLKGHSWGISLCAKNNFGSFINDNYVRPPVGANLHPFMTDKKMDTYTPLVDLMANKQLGGKTILYMLDALISAPSEEAAVTGENTKWQQPPFDNNYTASIFVSQDPVAIDSVGADLLMNEPTILSENGAIRHHPEIESYLHEAGQIAAAPSGVTYYDGTGHAVKNLGTHEHWTNTRDKTYTRNQSNKNGIELLYIDMTKQ